jgi:hypothetical protein
MHLRRGGLASQAGCGGLRRLLLAPPRCSPGPPRHLDGRERRPRRHRGRPAPGCSVCRSEGAARPRRGARPPGCRRHRRASSRHAKAARASRRSGPAPRAARSSQDRRSLTHDRARHLGSADVQSRCCAAQARAARAAASQAGCPAALTCSPFSPAPVWSLRGQARHRTAGSRYSPHAAAPAARPCGAARALPTAPQRAHQNCSRAAAAAPPPDPLHHPNQAPGCPARHGARRLYKSPRPCGSYPTPRRITPQSTAEADSLHSDKPEPPEGRRRQRGAAPAGAPNTRAANPAHATPAQSTGASPALHRERRSKSWNNLSCKPRHLRGTRVRAPAPAGKGQRPPLVACASCLAPRQSACLEPQAACAPAGGPAAPPPRHRGWCSAERPQHAARYAPPQPGAAGPQGPRPSNRPWAAGILVRMPPSDAGPHYASQQARCLDEGELLIVGALAALEAVVEVVGLLHDLRRRSSGGGG